MQYHVSLCPYLAFLAYYFDELTEWKKTLNWPFCNSDYQPLVLECFRLSSLYKDLGELAVVGYKHSVMAVYLFIGYIERLLECNQLLLCCF